jgi:hypothetical protein
MFEMLKYKYSPSIDIISQWGKKGTKGKRDHDRNRRGSVE